MDINIAGTGVTDNKHITGISDSDNEVFTPDSIVNEMLDQTDLLLKYNGIQSDSDYIDYVILEPTCGTGNFIIRELERKLKLVNKNIGKEREIALLRALASIHGIELTAANVVITKLRIMELIETGKTDIFELKYKRKQEFEVERFELTPDMKKSVQYILDRNIQCGNSLKFKKMLMNKSNLFDNLWDIEKSRINSAVVSTSDIELELMLTQYDFNDHKVAIRERSYRNMHENIEIYENTSNYVDYYLIYTLRCNEIYNKTNDDEEFDF